MTSDNLSTRILNLIGEREYRPQTLRELADQLGVTKKEYHAFRRAADALHHDGRVIIGEGHVVMPPEMRGKIIGTYRANPRGFGFVVPESATAHGDLYIPRGQQKSATTGDIVLTRVLKKGKRGDRMVFEGRVVRVLERGRSQFVGCLEKKGDRWFITPEGRAWHEPIFIPDATAKNAKPRAKVVVQITQYPTPESEAQGVIIEVLGRHGDSSIDTISIIKQHHLPHEHSKQCLQQAQAAAVAFDPNENGEDRVDLRQETIATIDPASAKDYDDAISLEFENEVWELGVHIADVARFVELGSPIDDEAKQRGNSVYFPQYVIPMLPEALSNGVCSLQEGVPRLTKSVFIRYDVDGQVLGQRFCNSIISSRQRLTYEQATLILEGKTGGFAAEIVTLVKDMNRLARIIQRRRVAGGMITLDLPAFELELDDAGRLVDVVPEDRSFSHTIIEMFMIEANEAAAELLTRLKLPHLRRIHPEPERQSGSNISEFLNAKGYQLPKNPERCEIQEVLHQVAGKPESFSVNLAILRSMQQAEYAPKLIGHYALASECYAHFTSPIRRYADLTIHRLIDRHLTGGPETKHRRSVVPSRQQLTKLGAHCSFTERRAESAERELKLIKVLQCLTDHVGSAFRGVVSSVTEFGVFIQLDKYGVEGLVRRNDLPDERWRVLPNVGCLVGERTGKCITIGDVVEVTIIRVDVPARQLDLHLDQQVSHAGSPTKKSTPSRSRDTAKQRRLSRTPSRRGRRRR